MYWDVQGHKRLHVDRPSRVAEAEDLLCPDVGPTVNRESGDMKVLSAVFSRVGSSTVVADGGGGGGGGGKENAGSHIKHKRLTGS